MARPSVIRSLGCDAPGVKLLGSVQVFEERGRVSRIEWGACLSQQSALTFTLPSSSGSVLTTGPFWAGACASPHTIVTASVTAGGGLCWVLAELSCASCSPESCAQEGGPRGAPFYGPKESKAGKETGERVSRSRVPRRSGRWGGLSLLLSPLMAAPLRVEGERVAQHFRAGSRVQVPALPLTGSATWGVASC